MAISGRILIASRNGGDVTESKDAPIGLDRHFGNGLGARECAGHPEIDAIGRGVDGAARDDGILPGDAVEDLLGRYAQCRELRVAEFDEDALRPLANEIDLVHIRNAQQALPDVFGPLGIVRHSHLEISEGIQAVIDCLR